MLRDLITRGKPESVGKWLEKREEIRENLASKEACNDSSDK